MTRMLVRQGIRGLLELVPDIKGVGEASDGEERRKGSGTQARRAPPRHPNASA